MTIQQLTLLTGNSASHLSDVLSNLSDRGVDIRAHCLVDNGDGHCKLRMVVSDPERAMGIFQDNNIAAVVNDVVILETDDKPGGLSRMLRLFQGDNLRVEYTYTAASHRPGMAVMVFRFSDNGQAVRFSNGTVSNCSMPEPVASTDRRTGGNFRNRPITLLDPFAANRVDILNPTGFLPCRRSHFS